MADTEYPDARQSITSSTVLEFLSNVQYPAWKEDLIITAEDANAPEVVLQLLEQFPDEEYESQNDVNAALGELLNEY